MSAELLKVFGPATCLPAHVVEEAAEWLVDEIFDASRTQAGQAEVRTRRMATTIEFLVFRN